MYTSRVAQADCRGAIVGASAVRKNVQLEGPRSDLQHLAVTDVDAGRFHAGDRWARGAPSTLPEPTAAAVPRVAGRLGGGGSARARPGGLPVSVPARETSASTSPSRKASDRCFTASGGSRARAPSRATRRTTIRSRGCRSPAQYIRVGARFQVEGLAWMDREWSTSALGPDQVGWDWFALPARRWPRAHAVPPPPARQQYEPGEPGHPRRRRRGGLARPARPGRGRGPGPGSLDESARRDAVPGFAGASGFRRQGSISW